MRSPRLLLPALALSAALTGVLAGCSGDDDSEPAPDATPSESRKPMTETEERDECTVDVAITGKVARSWTGEASVITQNQSGPVQYVASRGPVSLTVLGEDGDFPALATVTKGRTTYTSQGGEITAEADGAGAEVDVEALPSGPGRGIQVTASFTC